MTSEDNVAVEPRVLALAPLRRGTPFGPAKALRAQNTVLPGWSIDAVAQGYRSLDDIVVSEN